MRALLQEATDAYNRSMEVNEQLTDATLDPAQFDKEAGKQRHYLTLLKTTDAEVDD